MLLWIVVYGALFAYGVRSLSTDVRRYRFVRARREDPAYAALYPYHAWNVGGVALAHVGLVVAAIAYWSGAPRGVLVAGVVIIGSGLVVSFVAQLVAGDRLEVGSDGQGRA